MKTFEKLIDEFEKMVPGQTPRGLEDYLDLVAQVYNGGLEQYVLNGYHDGFNRAMQLLRDIESARKLRDASRDIREVIELIDTVHKENDSLEDLADLEEDINRLEDLVLDESIQQELLKSLGIATAATAGAKGYSKSSWQHRADEMLQNDLKALRASMQALSTLSKSGPPGPLSHAGTIAQLMKLSAKVKMLAHQLDENLHRVVKNGDSELS